MELLEALNDTLASGDSLNVDDKVKIPSQRRRSPSLSELRSNYEVTAKLFITEKEYKNWSITKVKDAINCFNKTTSLNSVDSLILSFNGISDDINHDNNRLDAAASIWKVSKCTLLYVFNTLVPRSRIPNNSACCS